MLIDISDILGAPGSSADFEYKGKMALEGIRLSADNVKIKLKVTNAGSRILLHGSVEAIAELSCSRCLEPFIMEMSVKIDEDFVEEKSPEAKFSGEADSKSLDIFTYRESENQIEIEDVIRQNLISEIPMQPLCSEDCRGLCPVCGKNQNTGRCECLKDELNPGLAPLINKFVLRQETPQKDRGVFDRKIKIKIEKKNDYSGKVKKNG